MSGGAAAAARAGRALLADFPVLVLDEPAEHLDTATADALVADLLDATRGRTTLLITHRLAGLAAVDEMLVLDGGRVVERGPHDELLAAGGRYAGMWSREHPHPRLERASVPYRSGGDDARRPGAWLKWGRLRPDHGCRR